MYERLKEGNGIEDIVVPDYPQLREILQDLTNPTLWESMLIGVSDVSFMEIIKKKGLYGKYHLDAGQYSCTKVTSIVSLLSGKKVEQVGLSSGTFSLCLNMMIK